VSEPLRIAMWSGPRNISTAMMRAWENRGDCAVSDEPLYAHYLAHTGADHPGRDEVVAAGETDWRRVTDSLVGTAPERRPLWYQKHMTHHLLDHIEHDWIHRLVNVFLIRDPSRVVSSYVKTRATVTPEDIGVPQQGRLFDELADRSGVAPPVVDADEFLRAPEAHLRALCARLGIPFTERMLAWPPGPRESDGVWAPWWYAAVERSTRFETPRQKPGRLDHDLARVADACQPVYESLRRHRIEIGPA
jgi:sulfotransferase family protein